MIDDLSSRLLQVFWHNVPHDLYSSFFPHVKAEIKKKEKYWFCQWTINIRQNSSCRHDLIGWPSLWHTSDNEANHEQMPGQLWVSIAHLSQKRNKQEIIYINLNQSFNEPACFFQTLFV